MQKNNYFDKILGLENRSIRFFADYIIRGKICSLGNVNVSYAQEIPALENLVQKCVDCAENIRKTDILKADAIDYLHDAVKDAIEQINMV